MEEFRPIKDHENYAISNLGNVKNIRRNKLKVTTISDGGYRRVTLYENGKQNNLTVHRLIADAFIPNPLNKPFVDHINNNSLDNRIENLRWCTTQENVRNASMMSTNTSGVRGVSWHKRHKKWISSIKVDGILIHIGTFETLEEAKAARVARARLIFGDFINKCETD